MIDHYPSNIQDFKIKANIFKIYPYKMTTLKINTIAETWTQNCIKSLKNSVKTETRLEAKNKFRGTQISVTSIKMKRRLR
jgi:hypothetical protein